MFAFTALLAGSAYCSPSRDGGRNSRTETSSSPPGAAHEVAFAAWDTKVSTASTEGGTVSSQYNKRVHRGRLTVLRESFPIVRLNGDLFVGRKGTFASGVAT